MRAALICLPQGGERPSIVVAGRSVAAAQVDFARRCGCGLIIVHGPGTSQEAVDLRHRSEKAGARFATIGSAQALVGVVAPGDSLLVLQPGLWPEADAALKGLEAEVLVLTFAAGPGQREGFERIDLDRGWGGALIMPGTLLEPLENLPEDIAPAPALLRVALQNHLPELRLSAELIDEGSWNLVRTPEQAAAQEARWLHRVVAPAAGTAVSARMANLLLHARGGQLAASVRVVPLLLAASLLLGGGALAACWFGYPVAGFAMLVPAVPILKVLRGIAKLRAAPAEAGRSWSWPENLLDAAIAGCAFFAIEGLWYRALFVPLVLLAGLLLLDRKAMAARYEILRDRGALVFLMAAFSALILPEPGLMLLASALLIANLAVLQRE